MNTSWVLSNVREAHEELTRTIARIETAPTADEIEFEIALAHIYNHLNTAWNSRCVSDEQIAVQTDEDFYAWRAYPADILMGMPTTTSGLTTLAPSDVLRIAQEDAEAVYRDLSGFKITLTQSEDGWHVDYDLTDTLSAGGGPHYVIHPHTGEIVSRRYEQ